MGPGCVDIGRRYGMEDDKRVRRGPATYEHLALDAGKSAWSRTGRTGGQASCGQPYKEKSKYQM
jgi:hypothetical protein